MKNQDDRIDRGLLDSFAVPEPSADLADRFFARLRDRAPGDRRRRRRVLILAGVGLSVAAAGLAFVLASDEVRVESGELTASGRTTMPIAHRAVAVAEPGAILSWRAVDGDAIRVDQAAGDVFYRVDAGAGFEVATPAGRVSVRGTCFRVLIATGADAVPAASGVRVKVDEGVVVVANQHGRVEVPAGRAATSSSGAAPQLEPEPAPAREASLAPSALTREQLLARDAAHRSRIARLEASLGRAGLPGSSGPVAAHTGNPAGPEGRRPFEMSRDELRAMADRCDVPVDLPPTAGSTVMDQIVDAGMDAAGLTESERAAVADVVRRQQPAYESELRALYRELTGEDGEALDVLTLSVEILQKSPAADIASARQRVAAERAGIRPAPASRKSGTVMERYFRLAIVAGDSFHLVLADAIGADRARAFRRTWGMVNLGPGCPGKESTR
jgi:hypothetical protein